MSVQRRVNWLSQQRVDVPDVKAIESAGSNDFDQLFQGLITGTANSYVIRGFEILMAGAIGGAASGLQMQVDPGALAHSLSSQSGAIYMVPPGTPAQQLNSATNTIVDGAFAPSAINYVGVEYERFIDDTTSSQVYFWDPTSNNETTKNAPRAIILRYRIKISTSTPASTVLPICKVLTDSGNNVITVSDCRPLFGRLGRGGFTPDPFYDFPWSEGRDENPSSSSSNTVDPFSGGDKVIGNIKDVFDALMTAIKEIKGTTYWYSQSSSGSLESLREDLGNTVITGRGHIAHGVLPADGVTPTAPGQINWDDDINIRVIGSEIAYTLSANPTSTFITLTEDKVAYITLTRGVTVTPNLIFVNSSPTVISVGSVAWTTNLQAGDWLKLGADTDSGYYEIQSVDSSAQVTLTSNYAGLSTGATGDKAKYAFGTYNAVATPANPRDIFIANRGDVPEGQDIFWLFLRSDNGGSTPRVYIRFLGSELEEGVDRDISDQTPIELLQYIGSPSQGAFAPQYVSALTPGSLHRITNISVGAGNTITGGQYFLISSSANAREYAVWFKVGGVGSDPAPGGTSASIEVDLTGTETAAQVAAALVTALNNNSPNDFLAVQQTSPTSLVRVTNTSAGTCSAATNFNVGAPFTITAVQAGTGTGNSFINDGDNLTLAIKKLDDAMGSLEAALDEPSYDETVTLVASGATPPTTITGPVTSGTLITLPNNSRLSNVAQKYTVGKGTLQVYLNGVFQVDGVDFNESGSAGTASAQISFTYNLVVGDVIHFRIAGLGGGSGTGGGGVGPAGPVGPTGPSGADAVGGPIAISTKTGNYTVTTSDNALLANCAGGAINFTLPTPSAAVGHVWYFKKIDSTGSAMTIQAPGSFTIDGATTKVTTTQYEAFTVFTDGANFYLF